MKFSLFFAAASAICALAKPVDKRAVVTHYDVVYETVYVTDGAAEATPTPSSPAVVVTVTASAESTPEATSAAQPESSAAPAAVAPASSSVNVKQAVASTNAAAAAAATDLQSASLYHHNIHRANHSVAEVSWNADIASYAAITGKTCTFAHDTTTGGGGYGQNIAMYASSSGASKLGESGAIAMAATNMWYNGELHQYPGYGAEPSMANFEGWGHFSQLVWKETTQIGCAAQFCPKGTMFDSMDAWYMVCNYKPAGNMGGSYGKNVLKPMGEKTVVA